MTQRETPAIVAENGGGRYPSTLGAVLPRNMRAQAGKTTVQRQGPIDIRNTLAA